MKLTMKLLALLFGVVLIANVANAESPREQLKQMVKQLQQSPTDNALREKVIKLAQTIKPAPAVPSEAERFEGRAQFAFKNAKSPTDYLDAAKEYEKAIGVAPWVAGYYADLCTIYEKAEKYAEAKKSCEFFLASSPSAQDASDVRKRIAGLEFAIEKGAHKKNQEEEFLKKLDGARFVRRIHKELINNRGEPNGWRDEMYICEIRGKMAVLGFMTTAASRQVPGYPPIGVVEWYKPDYLITGREFVIPNSYTCDPCSDEILTISEDGSKVIGRKTSYGKFEEEIYLREK